MTGLPASCRAVSAALLLALLVAAGLAAAPVADEGEFYEAAVRHLEKAVKPQRSGEHLERLRGLRQMRDPSLRPLFTDLAEKGEWVIRVHAILGLAEIDGPSAITAERVLSLEPTAQEALIANAIDLELLTAEQIDELRATPDLPARSRLLLAGEVLLRGDTDDVDRDALATIVSDDEPQLAALAALLLTQAGDEAYLDRVSECVERCPPRTRNATVYWLLDAIRQYELRSALPWVRSLLDEAGDRKRELRYDATWVLLALAPEDGLEAWRRQVLVEAPERERIRMGLLLLANADGLPPAAFDELGGESELIGAMADAGRAIAANAPDAAEALMTLIDIGNPRTGEWVMTKVDDLPKDQARRMYVHLIDHAGDEGPAAAGRIVYATIAVSELYAAEPETILDRLRSAEDDSLAQEILVLGLLEEDNPELGEIAKGIRRIGTGRADNLTLLLLARNSVIMDAEALGQLGLLVRGGGQLGDGLRTQAAWMYLRHTDAIDAALTRVAKELHAASSNRASDSAVDSGS